MELKVFYGFLEKKLRHLQFPLSFCICLFKLENEGDRYKKLGYKGPHLWYVGQSIYNESHFGWNGHNKDGTTKGTIEGTVLFRACL